jgi:predicted RNA binding protein YcfA (HicA-like mRNA interferase family)
MKRKELIQHLITKGCILLREGLKHSVYLNKLKNRVSTVPRHTEINDFLARKICRDLEIPPPGHDR